MLVVAFPLIRIPMPLSTPLLEIEADPGVAAKSDRKAPCSLPSGNRDTVYKKRRLANEVRVMRQTQNQANYFKKKQIQHEQKAMADKIKQL